MAPIYLNDASDLSQSDMIPLGEYLFLRLVQANPKMKSIFGIPGDFNLSLLEHLYTESVSEKLRYIGLCNELNAGYTADGYAQSIGGLAAVITTYGVGELSAMNAIAGSFAEFSPVLHIVGTTSTKQRAYANDPENYVKNIHHLVQNKNPLAAPNHDVYKTLVDPFTVANESLTIDGNESGENLEKIDKVLSTIIQESRPGYIFIPSDLPDMLVSKERLNTPLILNQISEEGEKVLSDISDRILMKLYNSTRPAIIGDALVKRFNFDKSFNEFVDKLPANFVRLFSTNMSRYINEDLTNYVGVYFGKLSPSEEIIHDLEDRTDLLITFGFHNVETNNGVYSSDYSKIKDYVEIHPDYVKIDNEYIQLKNYDTGKRLFSLGHLIDELSRSYNETGFTNNNQTINNITYKFEPKKWASEKNILITQNKLVDFFNSYLQPNDLFVVETCAFMFAVPDLKFPPGVQFISQNFFGSIGYALPATLGVSIAAKDLGTNRRVVLVQGDGSAHMTVQELSTYLRYEIENPKIFLINNEGYTVERVIKGPTRSYNDIQSTWDWCALFKTFGDVNGDRHVSVKLKNSDEFDQYFKSTNDTTKIEFIELLLQKLDHPERLDMICSLPK